MSDKSATRLELAHYRYHSEIASLVSPLYKDVEYYEALKPVFLALYDEMRCELLANEDETIEFLSRNHHEVENFFGDIILHFNSQRINEEIYTTTRAISRAKPKRK